MWKEWRERWWGVLGAKGAGAGRAGLGARAAEELGEDGSKARVAAAAQATEGKVVSISANALGGGRGDGRRVRCGRRLVGFGIVVAVGATAAKDCVAVAA